MAIVNNSGCGGAGCFRFLGDATKTTQDSEKVESVGTITHFFPHWFAPELATFGGQEPPYPVTNEKHLPFDLHYLKALVAPRVLYTNEGTEDVWANTHGSVLTRQAAQPVFDLLGVPGNNVQTIRDGGHGFDARDWRRALDVANRLNGRHARVLAQHIVQQVTPPVTVHAQPGVVLHEPGHIAADRADCGDLILGQLHMRGFQIIPQPRL